MLQQQLPALLSVALPRLHHQLLPAQVEYEDWATQGIGFQVQAGTVQVCPGCRQDLLVPWCMPSICRMLPERMPACPLGPSGGKPGRLQALQRRGQTVAPTEWGAVSQVIVVDPDTGVLSGAADPRKDGAAAAY